MASENVQTLTDANFEQTVNHTPQPVLVDFWAEWCGPRRRLAPTVDERYDDTTAGVVAKMNVDENPATPMRFSIRGIPTLLLFKGGQLVEQVVGLRRQDGIEKLIDKHVCRLFSRHVIAKRRHHRLRPGRSDRSPLCGARQPEAHRHRRARSRWSADDDHARGELAQLQERHRRPGAHGRNPCPGGALRNRDRPRSSHRRGYLHPFTTATWTSYTSRTLIIATGASARLLGIPSEQPDGTRRLDVRDL